MFNTEYRVFKYSKRMLTHSKSMSLPHEPWRRGTIDQSGEDVPHSTTGVYGRTSPHQYPLGQPDARVFQCQLDIGGTLGPFPVWWPHDMRVDSQDLVFQSLTYFTYLACANCFVCAVWTWAAVLRKKEYCSPDSMQSPTSTASAAKPLLAGNMWVAYLTSKHF